MKILPLPKSVLALMAWGMIVMPASAAPDASEEEQSKLVDFFTEHFSAAKEIVGLYRASFEQAKPFYDEAGIELPKTLLPKETPAAANAVPPATPARAKTETEPAAVAPVPTPAPVPPAGYRSPFKESHLEPSGPLNGAHLDGHVPMPSVPPTSSPTREDVARRAEYERANIEAYYFYKAMRERQSR